MKVANQKLKSYVIRMMGYPKNQSELTMDDFDQCIRSAKRTVNQAWREAHCHCEVNDIEMFMVAKDGVFSRAMKIIAKYKEDPEYVDKSIFSKTTPEAMNELANEINRVWREDLFEYFGVFQGSQ